MDSSFTSILVAGRLVITLQTRWPFISWKWEPNEFSRKFWKDYFNPFSRPLMISFRLWPPYFSAKLAPLGTPNKFSVHVG